MAGVNGAVTAPFVPAIIWATGVLLEKKLIEDHADATGAQPFGEGPDALAFEVAGLAVADEDFGHEGRHYNLAGVDSSASDILACKRFAMHSKYSGFHLRG